MLGHCVVPENIHTPPPPKKVFLFYTHLPPGNSSLASYFASKTLAFKTPLPLGISNDLPWGGYGFFLELHIDTFFTMKQNVWQEIWPKKFSNDYHGWE